MTDIIVWSNQGYCGQFVIVAYPLASEFGIKKTKYGGGPQRITWAGMPTQNLNKLIFNWPWRSTMPMPKIVPKLSNFDEIALNSAR